MNEAVFWGIVIVLALVGLEIYRDVQAFAAWLHVSMSVAGHIALYLAIVAAICVVALYRGFFLRLLPYLPAALFACFIPALDYWAFGYIGSGDNMFASKVEPGWYGEWWWQLAIFAALAAGGWFVPKWANGDYDY